MQVTSSLLQNVLTGACFLLKSLVTHHHVRRYIFNLRPLVKINVTWITVRFISKQQYRVRYLYDLVHAVADLRDGAHEDDAEPRVEGFLDLVHEPDN